MLCNSLLLRHVNNVNNTIITGIFIQVIFYDAFVISLTRSLRHRVLKPSSQSHYIFRGVTIQLRMNSN